MTLNCLRPTATQLMSDLNEGLTLFDRIQIANCAVRRAEMNVCNNERFHGEFLTARTWSKYRCYITKECQFIESN
jgi:hypothetical protein